MYAPCVFCVSFSSVRAAWVGVRYQTFSFCYIFPVQQTTSFFVLAANTLNVRNNNFPPDWGMLRRSKCVQICFKTDQCNHCSHLKKIFIFSCPLLGGCSQSSDAFRFFFKPGCFVPKTGHTADPPLKAFAFTRY